MACGNIGLEWSCISFSELVLKLSPRVVSLVLPVALVLLAAGVDQPAAAQENPYIVAYDHNLEEPGNLEVEYFSTFGTERGGPNFHGFWSEFEYGATAW